MTRISAAVSGSLELEILVLHIIVSKLLFKYLLFFFSVGIQQSEREHVSAGLKTTKTELDCVTPYLI